MLYDKSWHKLQYKEEEELEKGGGKFHRKEEIFCTSKPAFANL